MMFRLLQRRVLPVADSAGCTNAGPIRYVISLSFPPFSDALPLLYG